MWASRSRSTRQPGAPRSRTRSPCGPASSCIRSSASTSGPAQVIRDSATWAAFAHDLNRAGAMAQARGAAARLPQPQLGVLPAHRRPVEDRVRRPHRGDGPPLRPLRAGPVLDLARSARPRRHPSPDRRPRPAVPRQGPEPGRELRGPGPRPHRLRAHLPDPGGRTSTSSSATTRARRPGCPPTPSRPPGWATSTSPTSACGGAERLSPTCVSLGAAGCVPRGRCPRLGARQ